MKNSPILEFAVAIFLILTCVALPARSDYYVTSNDGSGTVNVFVVPFGNAGVQIASIPQAFVLGIDSVSTSGDLTFLRADTTISNGFNRITTVNASGVILSDPTITQPGIPTPSSTYSLFYDDSGVLYFVRAGVNSNIYNYQLNTINPTSGVVSLSFVLLDGQFGYRFVGYDRSEIFSIIWERISPVHVDFES